MTKKRSTPVVTEQERIKRLEHRYLVLSVTVLLLVIFGIVLTLRCRLVFGAFEFLTEQLDFIRQQVDAIGQIVQDIT